MQHGKTAEENPHFAQTKSNPFSILLPEKDEKEYKSESNWRNLSNVSGAKVNMANSPQQNPWTLHP